MSVNSYKTLTASAEGVYREKGSKFIAYAIPVETEEEVKEHLIRLKKEHFDARHHCYAYILGPDKEKFRMNDDGEPSSTAGRPIYGQLLSFQVTNILVIVVRYFGGTKLGASGLITAYKTATKLALEQANIVEKEVELLKKITFDYLLLNNVMKILKNDGVSIKNQDCMEKYEIIFSVQKRVAERIMKALEELRFVAISDY